MPQVWTQDLIGSLAEELLCEEWEAQQLLEQAVKEVLYGLQD